MNPNSLLDLAFGDDGGSADNSHLPEAQYLPALEKQKELEALLRQQQVGLCGDIDIEGFIGAFRISFCSLFVCKSYIGTTYAVATNAAATTGTTVLRRHAPAAVERIE